jgi:hypothetical protein
MPCGCLVTVDNEKRFLALASTSAHSTILSTTSRTTLKQTYVNNTGSLTTEACYVFPIYDGVSVTAFTCTIGEKVIQGTVKEREEARRVFDRAVARGQAAGLLEQSLSAADVFTIKLGNVPAGEHVEVEITYLGELEHDAELDGLRFTIPTAIAPRYGYGDHTARGNVALAPEVKVQGKIAITVDVDMGPGCAVKSVQSPSHPISVNIGTISTNETAHPSPQMASASLSLGSAELDKDFVVQVISTGLGFPSAILEAHPTKANCRTIMATLVPRFNLPVETPEIVFICDRSGSMGIGQKIPNLISALNIFLKSLPIGARFNICSFGTQYSFLWPQSVEYTQRSLDEAVEHVKAFSANYGGTEMLAPMRETLKQRIPESNLEVFLLTDGEIWDQDQLFKLINQEITASKGAIRVFSLGIGEDVSHALIKGVARAGNGFSQVAGENEKIDKKIVRMLKGALTPHVIDYTLEVKYDTAEATIVSEEANEHDGFELVEKVMDSLTIDVKEPPKKIDDVNPEKPKTPISLFDPNIKNKDLEMKDASKELEENAKRPLPPIDAPRYLQTPSHIPPLFPFTRTTVYVMLSDATPAREPTSLILKGTSPHCPLELEIPITKLSQKGTTLHQLAARKAVQELEDGNGWLNGVKDPRGELLRVKWAENFPHMVRREAVRLGVEHQVGGKWCSFVATSPSGDEVEGGEIINDSREISVEEDDDELDDMPLSKRKRAGGQMPRTAARSAPTMLARKSYAPPPPLPRPVQSSCGPGSFSTAAFEKEMETAYSLPICSGGDDGLDDFDYEFFQCDQEPAAFAPGNKGSTTAGSELGGLASLQTFNGSWKWSQQLEKILGFTEAEATKAINLPESRDVADVVATLCAVICLKKIMAADKDSWELMVEKAENWLQNQTGQTMGNLETLIEDAQLFP